MSDVRNIEGLRWLAEVQQSHAAQWALEEIARLSEIRNGIRYLIKNRPGLCFTDHVSWEEQARQLDEHADKVMRGEIT